MSSPLKASTAVTTNDASDNSPRPYIFIDSSNPVAPNTVIRHDESKPILKLPFPPLVDPHDLIVNKKNPSQTTPSKPPNAFIIYRRTFVETARAEGYNLPMTVVSTMASQSWDNEAPEVKAEYKNIARQAKALYDSMYPKQPLRKTPKRWRVFQAKPPQVKATDAESKQAKPAASSNDLSRDLVEVHETSNLAPLAAENVDTGYQDDSISSFTQLWVPSNDNNNVSDSGNNSESVEALHFENNENLQSVFSNDLVAAFSEITSSGSLSPSTLLLEQPVSPQLFMQEPVSSELLSLGSVSPASSVSTVDAILPNSAVISPLDAVPDDDTLQIMNALLNDDFVLGCLSSSLTQHQSFPCEQQEDFVTSTTFVPPYVGFYNDCP